MNPPPETPRPLHCWFLIDEGIKKGEREKEEKETPYEGN
jgi:hypothetical protein